METHEGWTFLLLEVHVTQSGMFLTEVKIFDFSEHFESVREKLIRFLVILYGNWPLQGTFHFGTTSPLSQLSM